MAWFRKIESWIDSWTPIEYKILGPLACIAVILVHERRHKGTLSPSVYSGKILDLALATRLPVPPLPKKAVAERPI